MNCRGIDLVWIGHNHVFRVLLVDLPNRIEPAMLAGTKSPRGPHDAAVADDAQLAPVHLRKHAAMNAVESFKPVRRGDVIPFHDNYPNAK